MAFLWRTDDGPTLSSLIFKRIRTSIAKEPYICDFSGGPDPCPPLDPCMIPVFKVIRLVPLNKNVQPDLLLNLQKGSGYTEPTSYEKWKFGLINYILMDLRYNKYEIAHCVR